MARCEVCPIDQNLADWKTTFQQGVEDGSIKGRKAEVGMMVVAIVGKEPHDSESMGLTPACNTGECPWLKDEINLLGYLASNYHGLRQATAFQDILEGETALEAEQIANNDGMGQ